MYTEGSEGGTFCEVIETRVTPLKSWVNWRRNSPVFSDVPRLIDQQEVDERVVNTSGKKIGHLTLVRDSVCVVGEKAETSVDLRYSSPIVRNETWVALKHRRRLKTAKTINKLWCDLSSNYPFEAVQSDLDVSRAKESVRVRFTVDNMLTNGVDDEILTIERWTNRWHGSVERKYRIKFGRFFRRTVQFLDS